MIRPLRRCTKRSSENPKKPLDKGPIIGYNTRMKNDIEIWHQHTLQLARTIAGIYKTVGGKNDTVETLLDVYCDLRRDLREMNGGIAYKGDEAYSAMKGDN